MTFHLVRAHAKGTSIFYVSIAVDWVEQTWVEFSYN